MLNICSFKRNLIKQSIRQRIMRYPRRYSYLVGETKNVKLVAINAKICSSGAPLAQTESVADSIVLTETETIFILDLIGEVVSQDEPEEYQRVEEKNQRYLRVSVALFLNDFLSSSCSCAKIVLVMTRISIGPCKHSTICQKTKLFFAILCSFE